MGEDSDAAVNTHKQYKAYSVKCSSTQYGSYRLARVR